MGATLVLCRRCAARYPRGWLIDLHAGCCEVNRQPRVEGYGQVRLAGRDKTLRPEALPRLEVAMTELLG